jgi:hypothetical protein
MTSDREKAITALETLLADERARALAPFERLFAGGPDTPCRTTWRPEGGHIGTALLHNVECVEVPVDDLRAAFDEAEQVTE